MCSDKWPFCLYSLLHSEHFQNILLVVVILSMRALIIPLNEAESRRITFIFKVPDFVGCHLQTSNNPWWSEINKVYIQSSCVAPYACYWHGPEEWTWTKIYCDSKDKWVPPLWCVSIRHGQPCEISAWLSFRNLARCNSRRPGGLRHPDSCSCKSPEVVSDHWHLTNRLGTLSTENMHLWKLNTVGSYKHYKV